MLRDSDENFPRAIKCHDPRKSRSVLNCICVTEGRIRQQPLIEVGKNRENCNKFPTKLSYSVLSHWITDLEYHT